MKLRQLRNERKLSLQALSEQVGMSPSYLNEIENGKKYPKVERISRLAEALGVTYDELVSQRLDRKHNYLERFLSSPVMQKFPFHLFGITVNDLASLVPNAPKEGGALVRALIDTARSYDMRIDDFLHTALRCYQEIHENYFEDVEDAVDDFRKGHNWSSDQRVTPELLYDILKNDFSVRVDENALSETQHLKRLRSVTLDRPDPALLINSRFTPTQKAFVAGREIGFRVLNIKERGHCSPDIEVESFEQVLGAFKASYFSSALFMDRARMRKDLERFFAKPTWDSQGFVQLIASYDVTPEMFFYRLCELLPKFFGLKKLHFLRVDTVNQGETFSLVKQLNLSQVKLPTGLDLGQHFCRRWLSIGIIQELHRSSDPSATIARAQRSRFVDGDKEFFCFCVARPLVLTQGGYSSVTIGFQVDNQFKKTVAFWDDELVSHAVIGETCERCPLPVHECTDRVAEPLVYERARFLENQRDELRALLEQEK